MPPVGTVVVASGGVAVVLAVVAGLSGCDSVCSGIAVLVLLIDLQ